MSAVPLELLVVALIVTALAAAVQSAVGFGFAVLSVPVLSLLDKDLAPVPQLLITVPLTVAMAWRERSHVDLRGIGWVLLGRLPGAAIGLLLLKLATQRTLDVLIGGIVIAAVVVLTSGRSVRRTPATKFAAGVASGTTGLVASVGGPPLALLYRDAPGPTVRSSLAAIFVVGLSISIATRGFSGEISGNDVQLAAILFPALAFGYLVGGRFLAHVEGAPLRRAILVLSALAAVGLLVRAAV